MRHLLAILPALFATPSFAAPDAALLHQWRATSIHGVAVEEPAPTILFHADGSAAGEGGCNGFGAVYEAGVDTLELGNMIATNRACELSEQEGRFFAALSSVRAWRMKEESLQLLDATGRPIVQLDR